jgi:hypothetical protein
MVALEKGLTSKATVTDLEHVQCIIKKMEFFDSYYGKFVKYHLTLEYKEYQTLLDDLQCWLMHVPLFRFKIEISDLGSFIRSFKLLKLKYQDSISYPDKAFMLFLNSSISELEKFKNQLIEPQN